MDALVVDMNGDGAPDVLAVGRNITGAGGPDATALYKNNGDGTFSFGAVLPDVTTLRSVAAADLDRDGLLDIVTASSSSTAWYRQTAMGQFAFAATVESVGSSLKTVFASDLDGDGAPDVAVMIGANYGSGLPSTVWFRNTGAGGLSPLRRILGVDNVEEISSADFTGDGRPDFLVSAQVSQLLWYANNGTGGFPAAGTLIPALGWPSCLPGLAADLDSDGAMDVLCWGSQSFSTTSYFVLWHRNAARTAQNVTFAPLRNVLSAPVTFSVVTTADLDNNGQTDILVGSGSAKCVYWYANNGSAQFAAAGQLVTDSARFVLLVLSGDMDRDGAPDVVYVGSFPSMGGKPSMLWLRNAPHGQASRTTAVWQPSYEVRTPIAIPVTTRSVSGESAPAAVTASILCGRFANPANSVFANGVDAAAGYLVKIAVPIPCSATMRIYVDNVDTGLDVAFEVLPPPIVCLGQTVLIAGACVSCPAGQIKTVSAASNGSFVCTCTAGYWRRPEAAGGGGGDGSSGNVTCVPCPVGGVCAGGDAQPRAAPGFYPSNGLFVKCPKADACLGDGRCASGYTGRLCGTCAASWYSLNGSCYRCNTAQTASVAAVLVLAAVVAALLLVRFNVGSHAHRFVAAMIGLQALQLSAMFGKLNLDWGRFANAYFDILSALNINFQLSSPECSIAKSLDAWTVKWALTMALPVFAAAVTALAAVVLSLLRRWNRAQLVDASRRTWVQMMSLLYLPLTSNAFALFGCSRDATGHWILVDEPSQLCYDRRWWRLFAPALIFAAVYGFALPGMLFAGLARARRKLTAVEFALRYGFLVGRFVDRLWFYEVANMATKLGVVLCITFFFSDNNRAWAAAMLLNVAVVLVITYSPYRTQFHNTLAIGATAATSGVLFGGTVRDFTLRRTVVIVCIAVTIAVILIGNVIDIYLMAAAERVAEGFFRVADGPSDMVAAAVGEERFGADSVELRASGSSFSAARSTLPATDSWDVESVPPPPLPPPPLPPSITGYGDDNYKTSAKL